MFRVGIAPDKAEDADGLAPIKADNAVWHNSRRNSNQGTVLSNQGTVL